MNGEQFQTTKAIKEISASSTLTERERHLIGLAVTLTRGCTACSSGRFKAAYEAGISHKNLVDLVDFVSIVNAGVTARTAITSSELVNLDEVCKDELCKV